MIYYTKHCITLTLLLLMNSVVDLKKSSVIIVYVFCKKVADCAGQCLDLHLHCSTVHVYDFQILKFEVNGLVSNE